MGDEKPQMFYTTIPWVRPMVCVQVDLAQLQEPEASALLERLRFHFRVPVIMAAWDASGAFTSFGDPCPEHLLVNEELTWQRLELPPDPESEEPPF